MEQNKNIFRLCFMIDFIERKMLMLAQERGIAMVATVHVLHKRPNEIGSFLRVGHTGHRKLENLIAASRLRFRRFVFDAAHIEQQHDLLKTLQQAGSEIVLDPNVAEMATAGRFGSSVSHLPWGNPDRPWQPSDFGKTRNLDTAKAIAEFAVRNDIDVVLAPAHCIESVPSDWISVDARLCEELRHELDRMGGKRIAIDCQIITTNTLLKDVSARDTLVAAARDLPAENLWIRASGFGATATGAGTRAFIESVRGFHDIRKPVIADYAGGLASLAAVAFGAVGGISHGMIQKEAFQIGVWKRPTKGGGVTKRIYVPELDRYLKEDQINALFSIRGTRSRFGCNDAACCAHGTEDMIENPHRHFIIQRSQQIKALSEIPEARRAEYFLLHDMDRSVRSARLASRLKFDDANLTRLILETKKRLINLRDPLGDLLSESSSATRSSTPTFRGRDQVVRSSVG